MTKKKLSTKQKLSLAGILTIGVATSLILTGAQTPTDAQAVKPHESELLEYSEIESKQLDTVTQWLKEDSNDRKQASITAEKERLAEIKREEERIAREKAEAEEAARIAAEEEAEMARIAEEERLAAEADAQAAYEAEQAEITAAEVAATEPAQEVAYEAPASRTDGFNFNGYHYDIAQFYGGGSLPWWTPYVYQWADFPSHYMVEMMSDAGSAIRTLGMGGIVTLNGQQYIVRNMISDLHNDSVAVGYVKNSGHSITIQTCDAYVDERGLNHMTLWFLDAI